MEPQQDANVDVVHLVRPNIHETDRDWALALDEELFITADRLMEAEAALEQVENALVGWHRYLASLEDEDAA